MSELFEPIAADQLIAWVFSELDTRDSVFGIPRQHFFVPHEDDPFRTAVFGHRLETPFGPAAGPHSQMAQNIVAAWLCGARYIELKTVQTLDVLDVPKPCIDMEDEGYNVEWSQELKVYQSFDEYLRAWILIHALHHKLGFPGTSPGLVFNLSVGYNLEGIQKPNVQWFLDQMRDCSSYKQALVDQVARFYPAVRDLDIPNCLSDNVTLSTMHGCPPAEIESISSYLMRERRLHTLVKCNPTLLGSDRVRTLINEDMNFIDVVVPDIAFEHDLKYSDAVPMLSNLQSIAKDLDLEFGVKLTNTLEVENRRPVFDPAEKMMYLSGRPLHAISVNLAHKLAEEFNGELPMSFSAGASCFNAPDLLASGMQTITVCSDLLKTGGYLRLLDYLDSVETSFRKIGASGIDEYILGIAQTDAIQSDLSAAAQLNLRHYAELVRGSPDNMKSEYVTSRTKTPRELEAFDCIKAPCVDECPLDQKVPQYMTSVCGNDPAEAQGVVREDNPIPCILGRACDHLCEQACIRTHLDEPVAIRDIKRYIMDRGAFAAEPQPVAAGDKKIAIIGAGPGGMSAAAELARSGLAVEIFEQHAYAGGMVSGAVPEYRLPRAVFDKDFSQLDDLGVRVHYNKRVGRDIHLSQLRRDGFNHIAIMAGAQLGKSLPLEGMDSDGVIDALQFLRQSREGQTHDIGQRIGIIGAGDTAMDCARVAWRQTGGRVTLIYRRTIDQMPADREEITQLIEEGIDVLELSKPQELKVEDGALRALVCRRMTYTGDRDESGRKIPHEVPDSDFEVPLDTLIIAISQNAALDFFDDEPIAVNERGYIEVDPVTFETSVPGVYAGGDVANGGPSSIVKAAAAGKAIANSILGRAVADDDATGATTIDTGELIRRRSHRERRIHAPQTALNDRENFKEVMLTYSNQQALKEAARCLDCDTYCSICVGVCPNLALQTYEVEPSVHVKQHYQVAVLTDFCNECGNCTTFCPTSGQPYRDKPRLYLHRPDFEAQDDNAFMIFRDDELWAMDARWHGTTHHIKLGDEIDVSHEPYATMYVLLKGLKQSMPYLPTAGPVESAAAGKIAHPGYEE